MPAPPGISPTEPSGLDVLESDAHISVRTAHDYMWSTFTSFGIFLLIIVLAFFAIWALSVVVVFLLRQCGVAPHFQRVAKFVIWILLGTLTLVLAFIAIGLDFGQIFITMSVSGIIFSYGLGQTIQDIAAGIFIQSSGSYELEQEIEVLSGGARTVGLIKELGLLHVGLRLRPDTIRESANSGYPSQPAYAFIPNSDCRRAIFYRSLRSPKSVPVNPEITAMRAMRQQQQPDLRRRNVASNV